MTIPSTVREVIDRGPFRDDWSSWPTGAWPVAVIPALPGDQPGNPGQISGAWTGMSVGSAGHAAVPLECEAAPDLRVAPWKQLMSEGISVLGWGGMRWLLL